MILVTGAAGKTGLATLRALARKGAATRALVHRAEQKHLAREAGAQDVLCGDVLDFGVLAKALTGVDTVYLICPNVHSKEFEIGRLVIMASRKAGATRIVYHSVMYPQIETMPHHWQKLRVEEELIQSKVPFTILQPASYMQNILPYWDAITHKGEYNIPYSVDSIFTPVDLEDVAEVACIVLTSSEHQGAIYALAGRQRLSSRQMAEIMGHSLGRLVSSSTQSLTEWRAAAKDRGMNQYARDALANMFSYYDQYGFAGSSLILDTLLGRPATTFSQFLSRI